MVRLVMMIFNFVLLLLDSLLSKEQVEASITKAVVHVATSKGIGATGMADVARTARVSVWGNIFQNRYGINYQ